MLAEAMRWHARTMHACNCSMAPRRVGFGRPDGADMARDKTVYTCTACGGTSPKWLGKCPHCGEWNTLEESVAESNGATRHRYKAVAPMQPVATLSQIEAAVIERSPTGLAELDRPLGGGIVEGGVVLIGGDPGIGKSTLLLQAAEKLSQAMP